MEERLQKYMASCGVASRRKCEDIILEGRVEVNGIKIKELGTKIISGKDIIKVDGNIIEPEENKIYILLNKPKGYVCTAKDEKGRKTILDLVKVKERIYPIGRLDMDTSGIIILTNDGEIYNKIIHPKFEKIKTYKAKVKGTIEKDHIELFKKGIDIGDYLTAPATLEILKINKDTSEIIIKIHEGKNRQVRRMCKSIGHAVIDLDRISIGNITKSDLKLGEWRYLTNKEIDYITKI
ncbi:rRNA pseudouridine synthase [Clostridium botulinum]|uniref:Pseudouridine synthase n=1 Tax=Clostridium combesii TaxID=39481 RepID=A0A2G7HLW0_9CLOT|nr:MULTISPECIES: pseudouridine synthase [Clostridium]APQ78302.1 pseudouridine synthase family protein [Clostridium botulinum]AUM99156.1 pseudouridine synthase [Clostridium botulinum]KEI87091.1 pseudouridine synthase [Clostridium botulinum B2 267]MBN3353549.1 rRNA pseudouridine synthase [Clostridium botulinum]MBY6799617.1 rRNA pseudouridine synthase [Clostridium botulinum]